MGAMAHSLPRNALPELVIRVRPILRVCEYFFFERFVSPTVSTVFTFAKNQGVPDGVNPIQDAMIPRKAAAPAETHATTPDEVLLMMEVLEKAGERKALRAVGLMFFAGLRPGEARGVRWEDFDGKRLNVRQSIWRTFATEAKTAESCNPVPIVDPLRSPLAGLRAADGNPEVGPILRSPLGKPLHLDNLAKRIVRPIVKAAGLKWHGWYALRRGIATLVNSVEKDAMAAKGLLRYASVTTTQKHCIKEVPEITQKPWKRLKRCAPIVQLHEQLDRIKFLKILVPAEGIEPTA
jgi:integrase